MLRPDGEALELGEASEEPHPQAGGRLGPDPAEKVHAAKVVSVELLVVGAILPADIDDGAYGGDALQIVHRADDRDPLLSSGSALRIRCDGGNPCA